MLFAPLFLAGALCAHALPARAEPGPHIYFVRGFANVFSEGLDKMAGDLAVKGYRVTALSHLRINSVFAEISRDPKAGKDHPVILIGHSLGANAVLRVARKLDRKGIAIVYMATFAATDPVPVSGNVKKLTNYYFATRGWGKEVIAGKGFRGTLKNIDFSDSETIGHFSIDEDPELQNQVINNVIRFAG